MASEGKTKLSIVPHVGIQTALSVVFSAALLRIQVMARARRTPHAPAVICDGTTLTYAELNTRTNQLARHLISHHHAGPEDIIALALPRSAELITAILAITKTGAAYLPADPDYPAERVTLLVQAARARCLLTNATIARPLLVMGGLVTIIPLIALFLVLQRYWRGGGRPYRISRTAASSGTTGGPRTLCRSPRWPASCWRRPQCQRSPRVIADPSLRTTAR